MTTTHDRAQAPSVDEVFAADAHQMEPAPRPDTGDDVLDTILSHDNRIGQVEQYPSALAALEAGYADTAREVAATLEPLAALWQKVAETHDHLQRLATRAEACREQLAALRATIDPFVAARRTFHDELLQGYHSWSDSVRARQGALATQHHTQQIFERNGGAHIRQHVENSALAYEVPSDVLAQFAQDTAEHLRPELAGSGNLQSQAALLARQAEKIARQTRSDTAAKSQRALEEIDAALEELLHEYTANATELQTLETERIAREAELYDYIHELGLLARLKPSYVTHAAQSWLQNGDV